MSVEESQQLLSASFAIKAFGEPKMNRYEEMGKSCVCQGVVPKNLIWTPLNRVILEKVIVVQLIENLLNFYWTHKFVAILTTTCNWTLS
jgi:hypothetical protein